MSYLVNELLVDSLDRQQVTPPLISNLGNLVKSSSLTTRVIHHLHSKCFKVSERHTGWVEVELIDDLIKLDI